MIGVVRWQVVGGVRPVAARRTAARSGGAERERRAAGRVDDVFAPSRGRRRTGLRNGLAAPGRGSGEQRAADDSGGAGEHDGERDEQL